MARDVPAQRRSAEELAAAEEKFAGFAEVCEFRHVLCRIVPRPDGSVWLERNQAVESPGGAVLDRHDAAGKPAGQVLLTGLPALAGEYRIFGDRLLWLTDDDEDAGDGEIPYLAVFSLQTAGE